MKTPTTEELAEIGTNCAASLAPLMLKPWRTYSAFEKEVTTNAMQAALDAHRAAIGEGMPSVLDLVPVFIEEHDKHDPAYGNVDAGVTAVRNLMLDAFGGHMERRGEQHKLEYDTMTGELLKLKGIVEAVRVLENDWRLAGSETARDCANMLEATLSAAPVEPVPEITIAGHPKLAPTVSLMKAADAHEKASGQTTVLVGAGFTGVQLPSATINLNTGEIEPDQPATITHNGVDYIAHKAGDPCPVAGETLVEILFADNETRTGRAGSYEWGKNPKTDAGFDIIAYRVINPAAEAQAAPAEQEDSPWEKLYRGAVETLSWTNNQLSAAEARAEAAEARVKELEHFHDQMEKMANHPDSIGESQWAEGITLERKILKLLDERSKFQWALRIANKHCEEKEFRLAQLQPRPISVKPTKEDAGNRWDTVFTFHQDGAVGCYQYNKIPPDVTHWLPGNLSRLMPEAAPEDKERREFEAWWTNETSLAYFERFNEGAGQYKDPYVQGAWAAWQARAGKEGA